MWLDIDKQSHITYIFSHTLLWFAFFCYFLSIFMYYERDSAKDGRTGLNYSFSEMSYTALDILFICIHSVTGFCGVTGNVAVLVAIKYRAPSSWKWDVVDEKSIIIFLGLTVYFSLTALSSILLRAWVLRWQSNGLVLLNCENISKICINIESVSKFITCSNASKQCGKSMYQPMYQIDNQNKNILDSFPSSM